MLQDWGSSMGTRHAFSVLYDLQPQQTHRSDSSVTLRKDSVKVGILRPLAAAQEALQQNCILLHFLQEGHIVTKLSKASSICWQLMGRGAAKVLLGVCYDSKT